MTRSLICRNKEKRKRKGRNYSPLCFGKKRRGEENQTPTFPSSMRVKRRRKRGKEKKEQGNYDFSQRGSFPSLIIERKGETSFGGGTNSNSPTPPKEGGGGGKKRRPKHCKFVRKRKKRKKGERKIWVGTSRLRT